MSVLAVLGQVGTIVWTDVIEGLQRHKGPGTFLHLTDPCLKSTVEVSTLHSIYTPFLSEKAPSPSQLSVVELPGDAVKLSWLATALSGVLVYQIKWMPLGEGKAHEVRRQGQVTFQRNFYGPRSLLIPVLYLGNTCLLIACESVS